MLEGSYFFYLASMVHGIYYEYILKMIFMWSQFLTESEKQVSTSDGKLQSM